jgi:hypothetical protein
MSFDWRMGIGRLPLVALVIRTYVQTLVEIFRQPSVDIIRVASTDILLSINSRFGDTVGHYRYNAFSSRLS